MLTGTFYHTVDTKGRLFIPAKMRDELGSSFFVSRWLDDCLVVFSAAEWDNICEKIKSQPLGRSRDIQRFLFANATEVEPDVQGRIIIPQNLREPSGIERDVAIIGVMNRAEIWDKQKWLEKSSQMNSELIERQMLDLDI